MLNEAVMESFDFFKLEEKLNDSQRALRDTLRAYVQNDVLPNINPYWERAEFPRDLAMKLRNFGIVGGSIEGYGCPGLDPLSMGLVAYELSRGDGGIGTFYGVQTGLAMTSIAGLGSEEQKQRWLPAMARLEKIGAFGLTEPEVGSNAGGVRTIARRDGDSYLLTGEKRWIGNASIADLIVIWGRDDDGKFGGFVVENPQEAEGMEIEVIEGKIAKRTVLNAHIRMNNVRIPAENRLALSSSFANATRVLSGGRYGVAWEAAGVASACFEAARDYALNREQFGKPIAAFQLIQQKLVEMASEVTQMQLVCYRMAELAARGELTEGMASIAKYNNARKARQVALLARETLGGNGILIENHIARWMGDAEVIYTYEGTNEINMLIAGRELTGINAIV
ncbi:MAG: acyl-CoA dehydrogenase family protein [Anaerolineae bacterium]